VPVVVSSITDAVNVSAGREHTCAARQSGQLACWGNGSQGRLGYGGTSSGSTPVEVSSIDDGVMASAGGFHSCALRLTGQVECWGQGIYGQLGNGSTSGSLTPVLSSIQ
jgi:alpha-tubulin suppressor-like RCC1 family protein